MLDGVAADRHPVHQPAGAQRRPHGDARDGRASGAPAASPRIRLTPPCRSSPRTARRSPTPWSCCNAAKLEGERLTFDVAVLEGSLGKADGPASVFIDTIWFGVGSNGFTYSARARPPAARRPTSAIRTAPAPSPAGPTPRPPAPTCRRRTTAARAVGAPPPPDIDPRYQQRYNAPTCGKPPCCRATEAAMNRIRFLAVLRRGRSRRRRVTAGRRADRAAPARPRPSASRSSRRSCRR